MKKLVILLFICLGFAHHLYADVVEGKCGDALIYIYDFDTNKLTITGNGPMYDYSQDNRAPWYGFMHLMRSLVIEHGVTYIGDMAFWGQYGISGQVQIPMSVTSIGDSAFANCNYIASLVLSPNLVTIGDYAFSGCDNIESKLVLSQCLETIGKSAFLGCKKLSGDLIIPNSVKKIGESAFYHCGFNGGLYLGNSLDSIGESAFAGCMNLTGALVIPESVKSIGCNAFEACYGLNGNVVIPKNITVIEGYVFRTCKSVTRFTIHEQVTSIGNVAFADCSSLEDIVCYAVTPPEVYEHTFNGSSLKVVYVPAESVELYKSHYLWRQYEIRPIEGTGISDTEYDGAVSVVIKDGKLVIDAGEGNVESVVLVGMNGAVVLSVEQEDSYKAIDISELSSGVYIVKVKTGGSEYCCKVLR